MSLRTPFRSKASPLPDEEYLVEAYKIVEDKVEELITLAIKYDKLGNRKKADFYYRGVSYYYFLITYVQNIRHATDRESLRGTSCLSSTISKNYKIDCVLESLNCIQKRIGIDYKQTLISLFNLYGINYIDNCDVTSCTGIGDMIMEGMDDSSAFIIGGCEEINLTTNGEFAKGEFDLNNFVKPLE